MFSHNLILIVFSVFAFASPTPVQRKNVDSRDPNLHRSPHEISLEAHTQRKLQKQMQSKRAIANSTAPSPLSGVLSTATTAVGSFPIIGVPLSGLLSSLPLNSISSTGAISSLVSTTTGAAQNLPVLGDVLKNVPLQSILNGNPISNLANTISGIVVAVPVIGQPVSGALSAVSGAANSLPIS